MEIFTEFKLLDELKIRGRKVFGSINLAQRPDGTWITIPIMMAIGRESGKIILADGCTHGDEHEGTEGIIAAFNALDVEKMKGTFIGVPVLNVEAFNNMSRYGTSDFVPQDLNRIFPGDEKGYITNSLAYAYFYDIVQYVDGAITMHGGGNYLYLEPVTVYIHGTDKAGKSGRAMAEAFGFEALWKDMSAGMGRGDIDRAAYKLEIPIITAEIGGQSTRVNQRESHIERTKEGIINVLRLFDILEEPVKIFKNQYTVELDYIYGKQGGLQTPLRKGGEKVKKGEPITIIRNIFGEEIETVVAPYDAIVIGFWAYSVVQPHSWVYMLGAETSK